MGFFTAAAPDGDHLDVGCLDLCGRQVDVTFFAPLFSVTVLSIGIFVLGGLGSAHHAEGRIAATHDDNGGDGTGDQPARRCERAH